VDLTVITKLNVWGVINGENPSHNYNACRCGIVLIPFCITLLLALIADYVVTYLVCV